jgi:hypothetical protein
LLTAPILALDAVGPSTPTVSYKSCGDPFIGGGIAGAQMHEPVGESGLGVSLPDHLEMTEMSCVASISPTMRRLNGNRIYSQTI